MSSYGPAKWLVVVELLFSPDCGTESVKRPVPVDFPKMLKDVEFLGSPGAPVAPTLGGIILGGKWASLRTLGVI